MRTAVPVAHGRPSRWAYAAGVLGTVANLLLIGFYALQLGRPATGFSLGTANDVVGMFASACMIPVAVELWRLLRGVRGAAVVQAAGIAAMAVLVLTTVPLLLRVLTFEEQAPWAIGSALTLFGWVYLTGRMLRARPGWARTARFGRRTALAALIGCVIILLALPLPWGSAAQLIVAGAGVAVGLLGWLGIPLWILLVGKQFSEYSREGGS